MDGIPTLLGLPTDSASSDLRGCAKAPARIRAALACASANTWTEGRRDLARPDLLADAGGLDPAFAPGGCHWEPGGLTTRELLTLIQALPGPVVGADVVELNPDRDPDGFTAMVAAKVVKELADRMLPGASPLA